jgi:2-C-methyl-D-erythritol 4-phosphate cytidylyltransferase
VISVVIAAAGKGTRMNMSSNKLYVRIDNMPVLARSIKAFQNCHMIDEIILVVNKDDINYCKRHIIESYGFEKVKKIVEGGESRQESVFKGLNAVSSDCDIVLIHDGARPFIREQVILDSIEAAINYSASCTAVPVKNTIKRSNHEGFIQETLDRENLWLIQTPQAFRFYTIMSAHKKAMEEGFEGTDDGILVERMGILPKLVMGRYDNVKITTREDLAIAEVIAKKQCKNEEQSNEQLNEQS